MAVKDIGEEKTSRSIQLHGMPLFICTLWNQKNTTVRMYMDAWTVAVCLSIWPMHLKNSLEY